MRAWGDRARSLESYVHPLLPDGVHAVFTTRGICITASVPQQSKNNCVQIRRGQIGWLST